MPQCSFPNCTRATKRFACYRHWFGLSRRHQVEVAKALRDFKAGKIDAQELQRIQQAVIEAHESRRKVPVYYGVP